MHRLLPNSILRLGYRLAYSVLVTAYTITGWAPGGAKCIVLRGDEVLLVRHGYGPRRWDLPGGTRRPWEEPATVARREAHEELGIDIEHWEPLGTLRVHVIRATATLYPFLARVGDDVEVHPDGVEIVEARFFPLTDLPRPIGPDVGRALDRIPTSAS